jgi:hypothetical protein
MLVLGCGERQILGISLESGMRGKPAVQGVAEVQNVRCREKDSPIVALGLRVALEKDR